MGLFGKPKPKCSKCNKVLKPTDFLKNTNIIGGGKPPTLLDGVVCNSCHRYECTKCKGTPMHGPCSWCGGSVSPAIE